MSDVKEKAKVASENVREEMVRFMCQFSPCGTLDVNAVNNIARHASNTAWTEFYGRDK